MYTKRFYFCTVRNFHVRIGSRIFDEDIKKEYENENI